MVVISLGGSLIVPDEIDLSFLEKFKRVIKKHEASYRFVIVCGGGSVARKYIRALREAGKSGQKMFKGKIVPPYKMVRYVPNRGLREQIKTW